MRKGLKENLIPMSERTPKERKKIAGQGGTASGKARRKIRDIKEACRIMNSLSALDKHTKKAMIESGLSDEECTTQIEYLFSMLRRANKGSEKAAALYAEIQGWTDNKEPEQPSTTVNVTNGQMVVEIVDSRDKVERNEDTDN